MSFIFGITASKVFPQRKGMEGRMETLPSHLKGGAEN